MASQVNKEQKGIFADDAEVPKDESRDSMKINQRMHNFYFPMHWQEAKCSMEQLWIMNECSNAADIEAAEKLFSTPNYIESNVFRTKATKHILKILKD